MHKLNGVCAIALLAILFSRLPCAAEGALAAGRDQRGEHWLGSSYNRSTVQEARSGAMRECLERGPNCSVAFTFRNTCIAIAFGRLPERRSGYEWVTRSTLVDAQAAVMTSCRNRGGYCELKGSFCDTVDEAQIAAQRRWAEEQAADEARRRRVEAEDAARRATIAAQEAKATAEAELQRDAPPP
jgi:hypothetical protein